METIIVFRACVPIVVALLDWAFMGRQLPSLRSWLALAVLVCSLKLAFAATGTLTHRLGVHSRLSDLLANMP